MRANPPLPLPRSAAARAAFTLLHVALAGAGVPALAAAQAEIPTAAPPRVASLGACRLASGATLTDCRVAYRTYGRLSAARDNVVLVPTYFAGRSEDHLFMLGAYVDTARHHVVIVDALADGHSSSPSNTPPSAGAAWAALTVSDMVDAQHRLLTEQLGVRHLRAVVGISMGAFQTFEWAVRYPEFMDAAVSIFGSPRATTYDRLVYETMRRAAEQGLEPGASVDSAWAQASRVETLFMRTPRFVNDSGSGHTKRSVEELAAAYRATSWSLADYAAQLRAISSHDVSAALGGDMARAAARVRARMLVVIASEDRMVDPQPSNAFARLAGADTLVVRGSCGHALFWCDEERIGRAVRAFVAREPRVTSRAAPRAAVPRRRAASARGT